MSFSKVIPFPSRAGPRRLADGAASASPPAQISRIVTFGRPFQLPGMDTVHPPGTFEVRETREMLNVMWEAYRVSLRLMLVEGARTEALDVTSADLDDALARDVAG